MSKKIFISIFIAIFSILMAFGKWNPAGFPLGSSTLAILILIPILVFCLVSREWHKVRFVKWRGALLFFYVAILFTSLMGAINGGLTDEVYEVWYKLLGGIATCVILHILFKNEKYLYLSMFFYMISMIALSLLFQVGYLQFFSEYRNGRLWLFGENPNSTSGRFVVGVLFLLFFTFLNPYNWSKARFFLLLSIFPLVYMIIASGSRGSLVICALVMLIFFNNMEFRRKITKFYVFVAGLGIMVAFVINVMNNSEFSMLARLSQSIEEGGDVRTELLQAAIDIFINNPLVGCGVSHFRDIMLFEYGFTNTVHNLYGYILAVAGLVGFIPFAIFVLNLIVGSCHIIRKDMFPFVLLFFILLLAWKTGGILTYLFMWYDFSIVISLIERNERKEFCQK